MTYKKINQIV